MKKKIAVLFAITLISCTDPLDRFIHRSSAFICGDIIVLGHRFDPDIDLEYIEDDESGNYTIDCGEKGSLQVGLGEDGSQDFFIDSIVLSTNENGQIYLISGVWSELTSEGERTLEQFKSIDNPSESLLSSIAYLESASIQLNDLQKSRYELTHVFGEPRSIRPIRWSAEGSELIIRGHESDYVTTYMVEASVK